MIARRAIFRRYAMVLSLALAGTLLAYASLEIAFATRDNVERTRELHVSEARAISGRIAFFFEEIERNFGSIASSPWGRGLTLADRMGEYQRAMRRLPAVRDVALADEAGNELAFVSRTDPSRASAGATVDPALVTGLASGAARFGEVKRERTALAPFVQMSVRDRGEPARYTVATINLQFVSDELARMHPRGREVAYMLDEKGGLLAHFDVSLPLQARGTPHPMLGKTRAAPEGSAWARNENGDLVLVVWHKLANLPWSIIVESPWQEALGPVLANLYRALAFIAIAILLAVVASGFLADRMARPVVTLKEGAEALGQGRLEHRIDLKTGDELEELGHEFNRMADQLQIYTAGLEHLVDERTARLHEAMRARALFLAAASHDLRQPLYAISILADTLALHDLPADAKAALAQQRGVIAMLRGMFDNLLDLSRFESGEVRVSLRAMPLGEILGATAAGCEALCRAKGLEWRCAIADAVVETDPELVRRVAANLLSNAIRYTDAGSVSLTAVVDGNAARIEVADTGVGIAPEEQARVFDEFVQLGNAPRERDRGVGLGLAIVKKIDALLGTHLELESAPGKGTRVSFRVPLASSLPAASAARAELDAASDSPETLST